MDSKKHWEQIYETKAPAELSWTQGVPAASLDFIHSFHLPKTARIIDVGGGDSRLVDFLLAEGFTDLTVLDISAAALERSKRRLGEDAGRVNWIVSDVTSFRPEKQYDVWHDRATFHFLTTGEAIGRYLKVAAAAVAGYMAVGTFSESGPERCSGLPVKQYSEADLATCLSGYFSKIRCIHEDHVTPFETKQNFLFCSFSKRASENSVRHPV